MNGRRHLLLVDDEASIRDPLARYLERQGFRVTEAADAAASTRSCLSHVAAKSSLALIVMLARADVESGLEK